LILHNLSI